MRDAVPSSFRIAAGLLLAVLLSVVGCHVLRWRNPASPEALLKRADEMSWLNSWIAAEPLYRQPEIQFTQRHQLSKALYACQRNAGPQRIRNGRSSPNRVAQK